MQSMLWRWVSPAQTITTDMDDVTQHFAIINTNGSQGFGNKCWMRRCPD
jgi:hypothetical protein